MSPNGQKTQLMPFSKDPSQPKNEVTLFDVALPSPEKVHVSQPESKECTVSTSKSQRHLVCEPTPEEDSVTKLIRQRYSDSILPDHPTKSKPSQWDQNQLA